MKERLQKVLAHAGIGSRRACEELITAGRVIVDGRVVRELGTTVDGTVADIRVDGEKIRQPDPVYYALNKPRGVVTTNADEHGRTTVLDLLSRVGHRIYPVGRLDRASEGLLLLTNDGEFAEHVAHPRNQVAKTYTVRVRGKVSPATKRQLEEGTWLDDGRHAMEVRRMVSGKHDTTLNVVLREGVNREIRRIFAKAGHPVLQLKRVAIGGLGIGELKPGGYRELRRDEVRAVFEEGGSKGKSSKSRGGKGKR